MGGSAGLPPLPIARDISVARNGSRMSARVFLDRAGATEKMKISKLDLVAVLVILLWWDLALVPLPMLSLVVVPVKITV
jgi:hypothetical protein